MANHLMRLAVLTKFFFFLPWAARLLLYVGVPSVLIALVAVKFHIGSWEPFFTIGGFSVAAGCVLIYITIVLMMFPAQLMSLVSSRQYGTLPYLRRYLAMLIICVQLLLQIITCCILVFGFKSDYVLHFSLVVAVMFIISLVVMLSFVRLGAMQFIYFFVLPFLGWHLVPQLKLMSDFVLSGMLVCIWGAFLGWWFGWHPKKYHKSLFVMNPSELNKQNMLCFEGVLSRLAVPQNLESGILFGPFGNSFYHVRMFLMVLLFTGSIFALMFMFFPGGINDGLLIGIRMGIAIQIIQIGYNYSLGVFKNINKFWLFFSFERMQMFTVIEHKVALTYIKNLIAITAIIVSVCVFIPSKYISLTSIGLSVLASLLITPISLYVVFIIYAKWRGNIRIFQWVNGVLMALLTGACFFGLTLVGYNGIANYMGYISAIALLFLGVIIVLRQYAQRLWQKVDLVRVAI